MSGFKALNIESDDDQSDIEDDTKEIQIEDALKLYQNALKYHAEGPASFSKAAEAYQQLFDSEIFKYPESQPELQRIELYGPVAEPDDYLWDDFQVGGPVVATAGLDTGPSTLPQILHLSHKNYAQFKLENLSAQIDVLHVDLKHLLADAASALDHFVNALDKDDTDLDLWRRTASVGEVLNSKRVARFCLEAVLEGDDEGLNAVMSLPGLEEGLAGEQLKDLVLILEDQLSLLQAPLPAGKRRVLSRMLKQRLDTYQKVTAREKTLRTTSKTLATQLQQPQRHMLKTPSNWAELGDILLLHLMAEQHGTGPRAPASAISFETVTTANSDAQMTEVPTVLSITSLIAPSTQTGWPTSIGDQFPGLDGGQPTTLPQAVDLDTQEINMSPAQETDGVIMTLPSRKRSGDAAGIQDGTEEGRARSKRIRARDSTVDTGDTKQAIIDANIRWEYEQQLNEFQAADDWMFETVGNLFEKIGIVWFDAGKEVRQEIQSTQDNENSPSKSSFPLSIRPLCVARADLLNFLTNFGDVAAQILMNGGETLDAGLGGSGNTSSGSSSTSGAGSRDSAKPMEMPTDGLEALLERVNGGWLLAQEVIGEWVADLLKPGTLLPSSTSYAQYLWPEALKTMVVRAIVNFDDSIYDQAKCEVEAATLNADGNQSALEIVELVQTLFELHLDIYTLIKRPNSGVDAETITSQDDRLRRWAELAREAMYFRSLQFQPQGDDQLSLRFLWALTFHIIAADDATQDHIIECMNDLRLNIIVAGEPVIYLQNNAVMPELSVVALDKEISRLTTRDFFLKVTSQSIQDPASIIESLEPLLEALTPSSHSMGENLAVDVSEGAYASPELVQFLQSSDISVRLLLWQRLRDAYLSIDYSPMVVYCYLKMMRMLLDELKSSTITNMPASERQAAVLQTLRLLQTMTAKILTLVQASPTALECIDDAGLKAAVEVFGEVLQLLQVFNVFEDSLRVGQTQPPMLSTGLPNATFVKANQMVHDLQVQIWMILYALLREAIEQNRALYPNPAEERFEFLRCVHRNLGLRGICGGSNRAFVRMLKEEFIRMHYVEGYDSEQSQVLYDLYGLNCFLNPSYELMDHHCTHDAFLDRGVAMQAVDLLMAQASKLPIKELVKHSLKDTIDKVHGAAPRKKPTEAILKNRDVYRAFFKSPIIPLDLFNCLKGEGNHLEIASIPREDALLAAKGWYFMMGHIALTKFRAQKRTAPTPTEDVDIAIAFFMQDLEYSMDNWETWFRLAQAYDTKIEESVVWSAEKLNSNMLELVQLQRSAIHCYIMATALAHRSANPVHETSEKLTELYFNFACRLYSSSREPFGMLPFAIENNERFLTPGVTGYLGKAKSWEPLRTYTTWKVAKHLYRKAAPGKSQSWTLRFMLGKCLWKMHSASDQLRGHDTTPSAEEVLESFIQAVELTPDRKDNREKREPVLEPHYKLISIVHKMVSRGTITLGRAEEVLSHTSYARTESFPQAQSDWVPHVLTLLRSLRAADKSNWHHRMVARMAQVIYENPCPYIDGSGPDQQAGAVRAKHELTQQMFTKTMVLQVWRPECERAGRHFVYTARYTRFFVKILEQLKDRASLESLARRVRRRPHDVFEHSLVWQDMCNAYLRLLRGFAGLPEGLETATFSNLAHDEFLARKEPLERWMQAQSVESSPALDVLRDVQELKKINQSLMKPAVIDDLIGDAYAYLFSTVGRRLWEEEVRAKAEEDARRPPPIISPPRNPMMNLSHLMNMDGVTEGAPQQPAPTIPVPIEPPARKKIGVGRREVRSTAEGCYQKVAPVANPSTKSTGTNVRTLVSVVINSHRADGEAAASAETSAPGSIHDSADDESELSELEEEGEGEDQGEGQGEAEDEPEQVKESGEKRPMFRSLVQPSTQGSREDSPGFETADERDSLKDHDADMADGDVKDGADMGQGNQGIEGVSMARDHILVART